MRKWLSLFVVLGLLVGMLAVPASAEQSLNFTVVLKSESISDSAMAAIEQAGGEVTSRIPEIGVVSVRTSKPTAFLKAMLNHKEIASIGPSLMVPLNLPEMDEPANVGSSPADPANPADYTWGVDRVTSGGAAWGIHTGTKDVVVAVIDTGFDMEHPDLVGNIVPGSKTFVPGTTNAWDAHSHGTHVAGTIAANGLIKGVAPNVGLRAYRVFNTGGAQQIWITNAIVAAANDGSDVINMSLGGTRVVGQWYYTDPATGERIRLGGDAADMVAYNRAIRYAVNKGVTVVAAAGNDGYDLANKNQVTKWYNEYLHELGYTMYEVQGATFVVPASIPGVVTVSAHGGGFGTADRLAFYSNYGNGAINVSGPGGDYGPSYPNPGYTLDTDYYKYLVLSTTPRYLACNLPNRLFGTCGYGFKAGTSMATPHAAGVAALIISQEYARTGVKPTPAQVVTKLQQSAEDIGKVGYDPLYGHGLANAYRALVGK